MQRTANPVAVSPHCHAAWRRNVNQAHRQAHSCQLLSVSSAPLRLPIATSAKRKSKQLNTEFRLHPARYKVSSSKSLPGLHKLVKSGQLVALQQVWAHKERCMQDAVLLWGFTTIECSLVAQMVLRLGLEGQMVVISTADLQDALKSLPFRDLEDAAVSPPPDGAEDVVRL